MKVERDREPCQWLLDRCGKEQQWRRVLGKFLSMFVYVLLGCPGVYVCVCVCCAHTVGRVTLDGPSAVLVQPMKPHLP